MCPVVRAPEHPHIIICCLAPSQPPGEGPCNGPPSPGSLPAARSLPQVEVETRLRCVRSQEFLGPAGSCGSSSAPGAPVPNRGWSWCPPSARPLQEAGSRLRAWGCRHAHGRVLPCHWAHRAVSLRPSPAVWGARAEPVAQDDWKGVGFPRQITSPCAGAAGGSWERAYGRQV